MRKDFVSVLGIMICVAALCGLAALRFQKVTIQNVTSQQTNSYWQVLFPGQERERPLPVIGRYETAEYNIKGLYGLVKVDRRSVISASWTNQSWSNSGRLHLSDPSIEAAERINLQQMQQSVRRVERAR